MKDLRFIVGTALVTMFMSCSTLRYINRANYSLSSVDTPDATNVEVTNGTYEDETILLHASLQKNVISFNLANNSDGTVKIHWDNGAYIDENGNSLRILHSGVKVADKEKAQVPSVIAKGSQFSDDIFVADYVKIVDGQLVFEPLLGYNSFKTDAEAKANLSKVGSVVKLLLPIEVKGTNRDYIFSFTCDDAFTEVDKQIDATKSMYATLGICGGVVIICEIMAIIQALNK